jgi:hypothetical protein
MSLVTWTAVSDSTALAALPVPADIQAGTKVMNNGVSGGSYFTYTISTASLVADSVVAVNGVTGARWIVDAGAVIADGSVTTAKLAANAVTGAKVSTASVTAALNTATASLQGLVPGLDPWYVTAVQRAQALGLTEWSSPSTAVPQGVSGSSTSDPGVAGGCINPGAGGFAFFPTQYVVQSAKTTAWMFKCRFKQSALSTGGNTASVGLGSTDRIYLVNTPAAPVAVNWATQIYNGGSVTASDTGILATTGWTDLEISHAASGAPVIYKINGVQVASEVDTNLSTGAVTGTITTGGTMAVKVRKYFWAVDGSGN